jgi:carbonic anhydrase/acetyltransferase-like protein (isoleucine patch superfamily)
MDKVFPWKQFSPICGEKVLIAPGAKIIGRLHIGENSSVFFNAVIRADVNEIHIGKRTNVQDNSVFHVSDDFPVIVGDDVTVGHSVILHACKVGSRTLIGMGSTVMDGAEIGEDSVVAAHSLVTRLKKFPAKSLIMGNPAKWIRELTEEEVAANLAMAQKYVMVKNQYLNQESLDSFEAL